MALLITIPGDQKVVAFSTAPNSVLRNDHIVSLHGVPTLTERLVAALPVMVPPNALAQPAVYRVRHGLQVIWIAAAWGFASVVQLESFRHLFD